MHATKPYSNSGGHTCMSVFKVKWVLTLSVSNSIIKVYTTGCERESTFATYIRLHEFDQQPPGRKYL